MSHRGPSGFGLVALPFERSAGPDTGVRHAPRILLDELARHDTFDFELGCDPIAGHPRRILTPHDEHLVDPIIQQTVAATTVNELLLQRMFVLCIGGEHTISLGPLLAASSHGDIGVVQLDSRANLRGRIGEPVYERETIMMRISEMGIPTLTAGIRRLHAEEAAFIHQHRLKTVSAEDIGASTNWYALVDRMPARIYLTVDMSYFDNGPSWEDTVSFLDYLFMRRQVVACDITEIPTGPDDGVALRTALRLLVRLTGLGMQAFPASR